jgi:hypothetical protein
VCQLQNRVLAASLKRFICVSFLLSSAGTS